MDEATISNAAALLASLSRFINTMESALLSYEQDLGDKNAFSYKQWKNTATPLMQKDQAALSSAIFGSTIPAIKQIACNDVALSKNLDTFDFHFAGDTWARRLDQCVTDVVAAASVVLHT